MTRGHAGDGDPYVSDTETPNTAPETPDLTAAFKLLQQERDQLAEQLRGSASKFADLEAKFTATQGELEGLKRGQAEGALFDKLRSALPHAEPFLLRSVVIAGAEAGKVNRYPKAEELEAAAAAALDLIGKEAPALTRAPASGGGVNGAPMAPNPPPKRDPVRALFGPRK